MCQRHVAIVVIAAQGINAESKESSSSSNGTWATLQSKRRKSREKKKRRRTSCKLHFEGKMMTPFEDFVYLINHVLLGEEPVSEENSFIFDWQRALIFVITQTIEDFILLVGTLVAFIAFILWCCFPIQPKVGKPARKYSDPHRPK